MIRVHDLHKTYHDGDAANDVLRGVSLHIREGEYVALTGSSGSGKTTLLNVIGALDEDYTGRVVISGQELKGLGDVALSRFRNRTVAYVFQQFHLLPHLPVIHNVTMPAWFGVGGASPAAHRAAMAKAAQVLERVGLGHKLTARPNRLSGGEKQRVAVARALLNDPKILLADEPTGALDTENGSRVLDLIEELHRTDGLTVVCVTHESEVAARCERIIRIKDGVIVDDGPAPSDTTEAA